MRTSKPEPCVKSKRTRASPLPNEPEPCVESQRPEPHDDRARPVQRVRAPCRGHGFLRSHGPREQKVDGEWLMSRYRRPKVGRIRDGALPTNQGPSQHPNGPEPAAAERTRDAQQAPEARPAERTPASSHERPQASPLPNEPDVPHQSPHEPLPPNKSDTRRRLVSRRTTNPTSRTSPREPLPPNEPELHQCRTNPSLTVIPPARCSASGRALPRPRIPTVPWTTRTEG